MSAPVSRMPLLLQLRKIALLSMQGKVSKALSEAYHIDGMRRGIDALEGTPHIPSRVFPRVVALR